MKKTQKTWSYIYENIFRMVYTGLVLEPVLTRLYPLSIHISKPSFIEYSVETANCVKKVMYILMFTLMHKDG